MRHGNTITLERLCLLLGFLALLVAGPAFAAPAKYVLETPGVVWSGTSKTARVAVEKIEGVTSAQPDMKAHTMTVEFDDAVTNLDAIITALGKSGYTVPSHQEVVD